MTVIKYAKLPCPRIILAAESKIPWNEQAEINHSKDVPINSGVLQGIPPSTLIKYTFVHHRVRELLLIKEKILWPLKTESQ